MQIGFIGLGTMGASFARNLQTKGGHHLVVHDIGWRHARWIIFFLFDVLLAVLASKS